MVGHNEEDVTGCFNGINIDKQEAFVVNVPKRKRDTSKFQDELGSLGAAVSERLERVEHSTTELENKVFTEIGGVKENLDRFEEPFVKLKGKVMGALKELQLLNDLKTTTTTSKAKSKGLMYVDIYFQWTGNSSDGGHGCDP
ncbi:predicted protein [Arabidopsis lyrata subsp. lyrata]|uniref:Predicted protein n=1 Tax=Arabidopsis lyrata subsp. lyrata TaxID=81972 RepID=D7MXD8_ARALL|nr:predicted protein [Arabidopsis lyrata subsp. lyrata]